MRLAISLLQGLVIVVFGAVLLLTSRASSTGAWAVMVIGFIVMIGKLYDHFRECQSSTIDKGL